MINKTLTAQANFSVDHFRIIGLVFKNSENCTVNKISVVTLTKGLQGK